MGHGGSIITYASLFLGGEYPKGIWRKAIFLFLQEQIKDIIINSLL
jgi:hypothetical protein